MAPAGRPLQAKVMAPKPLLESTLKVVEVVPPGETCKLATCAEICRGAPIWVASVAVSFAVLSSPPPETVAVLVTFG